MRRLILSLVLLGIAGGFALAGEGKKEDPKTGLVAHYFKDATEWDGKWKEGEKPTVDPKEFTFGEYRYSRIEPLINHLFIRRGWFSVRWVGSVKVEPGLGVLKGAKKPPLPEGPVDVTFELWCDDGARLFIDGVKLIDDWRPCAETDPEAHRKVTVKLVPGPHKIVVEYFQGESLRKHDKDPAKLYWTCAALKIKRKIIPAAHFFHTAEDLEDYEPSTKPDEGGDDDDDDDDEAGG